MGRKKLHRRKHVDDKIASPLTTPQDEDSQECQLVHLDEDKMQTDHKEISPDDKSKLNLNNKNLSYSTMDKCFEKDMSIKPCHVLLENINFEPCVSGASDKAMEKSFEENAIISSKHLRDSCSNLDKSDNDVEISQKSAVRDDCNENVNEITCSSSVIETKSFLSPPKVPGIKNSVKKVPQDEVLDSESSKNESDFSTELTYGLQRLHKRFTKKKIVTPCFVKLYKCDDYKSSFAKNQEVLDDLGKKEFQSNDIESSVNSVIMNESFMSESLLSTPSSSMESLFKKRTKESDDIFSSNSSQTCANKKTAEEPNDNFISKQTTKKRVRNLLHDSSEGIDKVKNIYNSSSRCDVVENAKHKSREKKENILTQNDAERQEESDKYSLKSPKRKTKSLSSSSSECSVERIKKLDHSDARGRSVKNAKHKARENRKIGLTKNDCNQKEEELSDKDSLKSPSKRKTKSLSSSSSECSVERIRKLDNSNARGRAVKNAKHKARDNRKSDLTENDCSKKVEEGSDKDSLKSRSKRKTKSLSSSSSECSVERIKKLDNSNARGRAVKNAKHKARENRKIDLTENDCKKKEEEESDKDSLKSSKRKTKSLSSSSSECSVERRKKLDNSNVRDSAVKNAKHKIREKNLKESNKNFFLTDSDSSDSTFEASRVNSSSRLRNLRKKKKESYSFSSPLSRERRNLRSAHKTKSVLHEENSISPHVSHSRKSDLSQNNCKKQVEEESAEDSLKSPSKRKARSLSNSSSECSVERIRKFDDSNSRDSSSKDIKHKASEKRKNVLTENYHKKQVNKELNEDFIKSPSKRKARTLSVSSSDCVAEELNKLNDSSSEHSIIKNTKCNERKKRRNLLTLSDREKGEKKESDNNLILKSSSKRKSNYLSSSSSDHNTEDIKILNGSNLESSVIKNPLYNGRKKRKNTIIQNGGENHETDSDSPNSVPKFYKDDSSDSTVENSRVNRSPKLRSLRKRKNKSHSFSSSSSTGRRSLRSAHKTKSALYECQSATDENFSTDQLSDSDAHHTKLHSRMSKNHSSKRTEHSIIDDVESKLMTPEKSNNISISATNSSLKEVESNLKGRASVILDTKPCSVNLTRLEGPDLVIDKVSSNLRNSDSSTSTSDSLESTRIKVADMINHSNDIRMRLNKDLKESVERVRLSTNKISSAESELNDHIDSGPERNSNENSSFVAKNTVKLLSFPSDNSSSSAKDLDPSNPMFSDDDSNFNLPDIDKIFQSANLEEKVTSKVSSERDETFPALGNNLPKNHHEGILKEKNIVKSVKTVTDNIGNKSVLPRTCRRKKSVEEIACYLSDTDDAYFADTDDYSESDTVKDKNSTDFSQVNNNVSPKIELNPSGKAKDGSVQKQKVPYCFLGHRKNPGSSYLFRSKTNGSNYIVEYFEHENIKKIFVTIHMDKNADLPFKKLKDEKHSKTLSEHINELGCFQEQNIKLRDKNHFTPISSRENAKHQSDPGCSKTGQLNESNDDLFDKHCVHCSQLLSSKKEHFNHLCKGKMKKGFLCKYCEKILPSYSAIVSHKKKHLS